jgi:hypothetical protein
VKRVLVKRSSLKRVSLKQGLLALVKPGLREPKIVSLWWRLAPGWPDRGRMKAQEILGWLRLELENSLAHWHGWK